MSRNLRTYFRNATIILILINAVNFILHISGGYRGFELYRKRYFAPFPDANYSSLLINTSGCKIADLIPHTKLNKYFFNVEPIECEHTRPPLFESNYTSVYMIESSLKAYGFLNKTSIKCCYMSFKRMPFELGLGLPDATPLYQNECVFFNYSVDSPFEFIKVMCFNKSKYPKTNRVFHQRHIEHFYVDFFYFIKPLQKENVGETLKVNILILGIDNLSRINFHRQMPKTSAILNSFGAIEFFGYHKLSEATSSNVVPLLSGRSSEELVDNCLIDTCKLILQYYKAKGYATTFIEDAISIGILHYHYKNGFLKQPTDYFWNIFYNQADSFIGNRKINAANYCFGSRKVHEILLEYTNRFITVMEKNKQPYFGYSWQTILSNIDINQIQNGDVLYQNFFNNLHQNGYLNNTILFFMSNHGNQINTLRKTYTGMLEDRLPLLFVKLPGWMITKYPLLMTSLEINAKRLVTAYDIHETLKQLITVDMSKLSNANTFMSIRRGYSLFSPIPEDRTCDTADIPIELCLCYYNSAQQMDQDEIVTEIAQRMILFINDKILSGFKVCRKLTLDKIVYARKLDRKELLISGNNSGIMYQDFKVAFRTLPSRALYEGTVRRTVVEDEMYSLVLSGGIARINTNYKQSLCVSDVYAKNYCFCSNLLH